LAGEKAVCYLWGKIVQIMETYRQVPRPIQAEGKIVSKPILGGLHHIYTRIA